MSTQILPTPLTNAYFSTFNINRIHNDIQVNVGRLTGVGVQRQNDSDLLVLMRAVLFDSRALDTNNVSQVSGLNDNVVARAVQQITTGMLSQSMYMRDINSNLQVMPTPVNTSSTGRRVGEYTNIGLR